MKQIAKCATILLAGMLTTMGLSGCGGSSGDNAQSKEVVLWTQSSGPDAKAYKATVDAYNSTKPDYPVKLVVMEKEAFNAKLATAGRSGKDVPDLAQSSSEEVPSWLSQGLLEEWGKYLDGSKITKNAYVPSAWQAGQIDGKQYGVPGAMPTWVAYYNKELVDKYAPGALDDGFITFEEIRKAGAAARADGIYSFSNAWGFQTYDNLYLQMGGKWLDAEGKISVDNEFSRKAFTELQDLYKAGYMVPRGQEAMKLFLNGKLIFMPEGTWALSNVQQANFKWGETFVPQWDLNNIVQCSGADQYVIIKSATPRSAEKMKGMVAFLEWFQTNQLEMLKSGANPSAVAMLENADYVKMPQSFLLKNPQALEKINVITTPGLSYVNSEIDARNWDMIEGNASIPEVMKEIQKTATQRSGR